MVEGNDDERFFESVIKPICENEYNIAQCWQYSQKKKEKINSYLNSIRSMQDAGLADIIIVADLDESPCVTDRKERVLSSFRSLSANASEPIDPRSSIRIVIVCREIESWYLAGLNASECERLGISQGLYNTDHLTKEQFLGLMPKGYNSRAEFMLEILRVFDQDTARSRNTSFGYFMRKYESDD